MRITKFLFFVLCLRRINSQAEDAVLCTATTCSDFTDETPCLDLTTNCKIQNSTHNGLLLPSPNICNCCSFCLENLNEGDFCAVGEEGGIIPSSICGPGLTCGAGGICVKMTDAPRYDDFSCIKAQADYDGRRKSGDLGVMEMRPNCDGNGFYEPYKCLSGQTCFCVDRNGKRIFGEIRFTSTAPNVMKCECSRKHSDAEIFLGRSLKPHEHFRCAESGDYDAIQCIGDKCMCVDASDGAPTYPADPMINETDISNKTLNCFKREVHTEGKFYHECALRYLEQYQAVEKYKSDEFSAVFVVEFPECTIDGRYAPVQKDSNRNEMYCASGNGTQIDNYRVKIGKDTGSENMNCKCARTRLLIPETSPEKPECCPNGNFKSLQLRRGKYFCVDEDGHQVEKEVDPENVTSLVCASKSCRV